MRHVLTPIVVIVSLIGSCLSVANAQTPERCFPETGKCISGVIRTYWEQSGGPPVFGFPITDLVTETNADGFTGPTQWFERDRLEDHSAEGLGVLAGRLGAQKLITEGRPWETLQKVEAAPANCRFFSETGHSLCPPFLAYWGNNGGLPRFGFPISEPVVERNADGFTGTFQWFERRRIELHPENQPPFDILLGLLGNEVLSAAGPPPWPLLPPGLPPPSYNNCQPDPNAGAALNTPVRIESIDKAAEVVRLRNVSGSTINLDGWIMCSIRGNQRHEPLGGQIAPGETKAFTYGGPGSIWSNDEQDDGALYTPNGQLVSYLTDR